jgi:hypothetical protein
MDHLAQAQAQERLHDLGVPRMSADPIDLQVEAELAALEEAFAGKGVGVDTTQERSREPGICDRWAQDPNPVGESASGGRDITVKFKRHTKITCNSPSGSRPRDEFTFAYGQCQRVLDCWMWWKNPDGGIQILGGGKKWTPTIYTISVKGGAITSRKNKDQSKAMELYNKYGRK